MSYIRQTSLTFGDAKERIVESTGSGSSSDRLLKAGRALQAAFHHWNSAANWKWLKTTQSYSMVAGTDIYTLPSLTKNVHNVHVTSAQARHLDYIDRRSLNRVVPRQDQTGPPLVYDLFRAMSGQGILRLYPKPNAVETFEVDYYRKMVVPCTVTATATVGIGSTTLNALSATHLKGATAGSLLSCVAAPTVFISAQAVDILNTYLSLEFTPAADDNVSTQTVTIGGDNIFIDCPEDYVEGILAWANHYYLINTAGSPRLEYWSAKAQEAIDKALRENKQDTPDAEIMLLPASVWDNTYMGTNDIRWADVGW